MSRMTLASFGLCVFLISQSSLSDIVFDGTTGTAGPATGSSTGDFEIAESDGRVTGSTLFHSFSEFSFDQSERARFTGGADIRVVLSRVTGGAPSRIGGELSSPGMNADFYFLNPNGVIIGNQGEIAVNGAFNVIRGALPDFEKVSALNAAGQSNEPLLTIADPEKLTFILNQSESNKANDLLTQNCASAKLTDRSSLVVRTEREGASAPGRFELASGEGSAMEFQLAQIANCF